MQEILNQYEPITLEDMKEIRLMNRIDTKFVTTVPVLRQLLDARHCTRRLLRAGDGRAAHLSLLYTLLRHRRL